MPSLLMKRKIEIAKNNKRRVPSWSLMTSQREASIPRVVSKFYTFFELFNVVSSLVWSKMSIKSKRTRISLSSLVFLKRSLLHGFHVVTSPSLI